MGKLIMLSSIIKGNGSKHLAVNLSYEMANQMEKLNKGQKVLLIDFDIYNPTLGLQLYQDLLDEKNKTSNMGIDSVIEKNQLNLITDENFIDNCIYLGNKEKIPLYLLKGTNYPERYNLYQREDIENILFYAKNNFDYVFVVADSSHNNAGFIYSLTHIEQLILVSRNNIANFKRLNFIFSIINQYYSSIFPIKVVYNYGNNRTCKVNDWILDQKVKVDFLGVLEYDADDFDNSGIFRTSFLSRKLNKSIYKSIVNNLVNNPSLK